MQGNSYTFGLEQKWVSFLQALSDAVVFGGTPSNFPSYWWQQSGASPMCK